MNGEKNGAAYAGAPRGKSLYRRANQLAWWNEAAAGLLEFVTTYHPVSWRMALAWARKAKISPFMLANLAAHLQITRQIKDISEGPPPRGKLKPPCIWAPMPEAERAEPVREVSAWQRSGDPHASVSGRYSSDRANNGG